MADVTLKAKRPVLTVGIGDDREAELPLTLTHDEYTDFGKADSPEEAMLAFFRKYLGEVVDEIGDDDMTALIRAWSDARTTLGEPSMGEPGASPKR